MEDLCWEVTLRELNVPPRSPPPTLWENPVGNEDPNVDDQEVNFLRVEGGNPQDNYFDPLLPLNQRDCGNPEDNLFDPLSLLSPVKM